MGPFSTSISAAGGSVFDKHYHFVHDADGNLTRQTDPLGHVTTFDFDIFNRQFRVTEGVGTALEASRTTSYDADDRVVGTVDFDGKTTSTHYDHLGRDRKGDVVCKPLQP